MAAARRAELAAWALCCAAAGLVFTLYVITALTAGQGELVLPLDDVYIHFQYARQLANGQPFVYNPGQPPTSGATSFLYPFALRWATVPVSPGCGSVYGRCRWARSRWRCRPGWFTGWCGCGAARCGWRRRWR